MAAIQTTINPTRKACDLCYRRKIKCDGSRPRCSHCVLHDSECTFTAIKRISRPRNQVPQKQLALQERVKRLEAQLALTLEQTGMERERVTPRKEYTMGENKSARPDSSTVSEQGVSTSAESLHLPPLEELISAVEVFSERFNWAFPLFHIPTLLRMIHSWYSTPHQRTPVCWAAINVVLALAHKSGVGNSTAADYLSKAQSAMTTIITDPNPGLLSVQVIVGMVAVFQGSKDLQPALILIATAMRLIHRLRMHSRQGLVGMDPVTATQCTRVFWIAYILDKDLSLRAVVPSIQQDYDIDLDFPSYQFLFMDCFLNPLSANDIVRENYLLARAQLARIEGRVYDKMLSARSKTWDYSCRMEGATTLLAELEEWKASLPTSLRLDNILRAVDSGLLRCISILHAASISCETHIHITHAHDEQWLKSLHDFTTGEVSQLSTGWQAPGLVQQARLFMNLFGSVPDKDAAFQWMVGCAYFSSMLILLSQTAHSPQNPSVERDSTLTEAALKLMEDLVEREGIEAMRKTLEMSQELNNVGSWKRLLVNGLSEDLEPAFMQGFLH